MAFRSFSDFISKAVSNVTKTVSSSRATASSNVSSVDSHTTPAMNNGALSAEIDRLKFNAQELRNTATFIRNEKTVLISDVENLKSCISRMSANWAGIAAEQYITKIMDKISKVESSLANYDVLAKKFDSSASDIETQERNLINQLNGF